MPSNFDIAQGSCAILRLSRELAQFVYSGFRIVTINSLMSNCFLPPRLLNLPACFLHQSPTQGKGVVIDGSWYSSFAILSCWSIAYYCTNSSHTLSRIITIHFHWLHGYPSSNNLHYSCWSHMQVVALCYPEIVCVILRLLCIRRILSVNMYVRHYLEIC